MRAILAAGAARASGMEFVAPSVDRGRVRVSGAELDVEARGVDLRDRQGFAGVRVRPAGAPRVSPFVR